MVLQSSIYIFSTLNYVSNIVFSTILYIFSGIYVVPCESNSLNLMFVLICDYYSTVVVIGKIKCYPTFTLCLVIVNRDNTFCLEKKSLH